MALTKVTGQVINDTTGLVVGVTTVGGGVSATDGFFSGIVTAVGDASFSGNVSVGGTLTYEDVTNIDAVGLVTARNGIVVGSGITLSKDGDGFFTGVVTATSYRGDGSNLTGVSADVVDDTSPQLGGNLDANDKSIVFGDSNNDATASGTLNRLKFGAGTDMVIYHNGTDNFIKNPNGTFKVFTGADKQSILAVPDGTVSLHFNDSKKFETLTDGVKTNGDLTVNNANRLYLENDSEDRTAEIRNSESSGESNIMFNTHDGSSAADRWEMTKDGHFIPQVNNDVDIGASSYRVRNIYTADLHCSNKGSSNDVDGTWGDYTIQEGESDLFLINNRNGKKYKFNLTEVS